MKEIFDSNNKLLSLQISNPSTKQELAVVAACKIIENKIIKSGIYEYYPINEACFECYIYKSYISNEIKKRKFNPLLKSIFEYRKYCAPRRLFTTQKNIDVENSLKTQIVEKADKSSIETILKTYCYLLYDLNKQKYEQSSIAKCVNSKCQECILYKNHRTNMLKKETRQKNKELEECQITLNTIKGNTLIEIHNKNESIEDIKQEISNLLETESPQQRKARFDKEYLEFEAKLVSAWEKFRYFNYL